MTTETLVHAVRDGIARTIAVIGLAGVALIHLLDLPGKFQETPYLGWLYVALILGCLSVAAVGMASLLVEGSLVAVSGAVLAGLPRPRGLRLVHA